MSPRSFTSHPHCGCSSMSSSTGSSSTGSSTSFDDSSVEESVEVTMATTPNPSGYDDCTNLKRNGGNEDNVSMEESIEMEAPAALFNCLGNRVCFGSVHIRTYDVTLGTRRSGGQERGVIPLTIGWDYDEFGRWSVDEFEKQRIPERRQGGEEAIRIDTETGYRVLREAGFTKHQIRREMFCADMDTTLATKKIWSKMVSKSRRADKGHHQERRKWNLREREGRARTFELAW